MGKKGNWITALKKAFTTNPKDKPTNVLVAQYQQPPSAQYRSSERDKKRWGFGRSRQHADPAAPAMPGALMSIPLYRQPSSIEKILGDAEMERQYYDRPPAQYQITPARPTTTTVAAATAPTTPLAREREREPERKRDAGEKQQQQYVAAVLPLPPPQACSPPPLIRRFDHDREQQQRLHRLQQGRAAEKITEWRQPSYHQQRPRTSAGAARCRAVPPEQARAAAVAIQAAFRGYSARRSYRSLRGLIRLQGVVRGPSVRRQTAHAMRCMRTLVRVQAQVRASRVEAMERRNRHGAMFRDGRSRGGSQDGGIWDDSLLSRDEADSRTKRKAEAVMKRERALAYAYSHQVLKATPMAAHAILADLQSGRNPWWWSPIDRTHAPDYPRHVEPIVVRHRPAPATITHRETMTPMMMTPMTTAATTPARSVVSAYYPKHPSSSRPVTRAAATRGGGGAPGSHVRDDESLTSCPAFGVPNYMTPTLSASAKARARAQMLQQQLDKERRAAEQKPRFSFGLGQSIGSWAKSPFWKGGAGGGDPSVPPSRAGTPAASVAGGRRHRRSVSGLSVDSTVSMPAGVGRRTFK